LKGYLTLITQNINKIIQEQEEYDSKQDILS